MKEGNEPRYRKLEHIDKVAPSNCMTVDLERAPKSENECIDIQFSEGKRFPYGTNSCVQAVKRIETPAKETLEVPLYSDGNHGTCVGVHSCPHLAAMVKQSISKEDVQYLQNSICDGPEQYSVCCGPLKEETQVTEAAIDEYPWLALIEYEKDGVIKALCNGALISGKYVLTPGTLRRWAHLKCRTPKNIRLGEYDTVNDGRDCINIEGGGVDCTDPPVVIPIELTILHPQIELNSRKNDIALIRMRQNAPFTDFIQPICLPTVDVTASRSDEDRY
ncbi:phenoloxidase-activating enzyme-like [Galleria mellonella]|uniref:Phenoloxidase-activating enzyme-like n=1 Tax=Galleria mellonella TaxID=7137 RepID=A0ABM3MDP1_GALME|nr:phenoloxidase-activating enzyme-like [Galleria mellonella]